MIKRLFDLTIAMTALILLFPLMIITFFFVRIKLGPPVIFCQVRPGIYNQPFKMLKFRSMRDAVDHNGNVLPDDMRLTRFGKILRSTSLDELPGLINVLKGDMSIVGPRPLLMQYLPLYSERQARRHHVRPGITGWAQVNGRNAISWNDKFEFDVWYVDNQSIWLDIKIIFMTVKKVFFREGITSAGEATTKFFEGNK